ncbi:MAG: right-handed parallel beta-helix repeat-containing protein [Candidatus Hodarchaeales archaeon]|jgi:parallel beta-helix repeat protein
MKRNTKEGYYSIFLFLVILMGIMGINHQIHNLYLQQNDSNHLIESFPAEFDSKLATHLISHYPIEIYNNVDFKAQATARGWTGDGTSANPFLIENFQISEPWVNVYLISISNSIYSFQINNCVLQGGIGGIRLSNVDNGQIINNIITNNNYRGTGIMISDDSSNIRIENNTIINQKDYAIYSGHSGYSTILNNTITNNRGTGLYLYGSAISLIKNNNISNNGETGIYFHHHGSCTISGNTITNNGGTGIYFLGSGIRLITNNTVTDNGGTGIYIRGSSNITHNTMAKNNGGGLILDDSPNSTIENNKMMSNSGIGFSLYNSPYSTITNISVIHNGGIGISLRDSTGSSIIENIMINNSGNGLSLNYSPNSTIENNNVTSNDGIGLKLDHSSASAIINNNLIYNKNQGIELFNSGSTLITRNNMTHSSHEGLLLVSSGNNIIINNYLMNNSFSISGSKDEHYIQAFVKNNSFIGVQQSLIYWQNNTEGTIPTGAHQIILVGCNSVEIIGQTLNGFWGVNSSNIILRNNSISHSSASGLYLRNSRNITIVNNSVSNNGGTGLSLVTTGNCTIRNNNLSNNGGTGLFVDSSWNTTILDTTVIHNNLHGIDITFSGNNTIVNNSVLNNGDAGISLLSSESITILNNTVSNNGGTGLSLDSTWNTTVVNTTATSNDQHGMHISYSENNLFENNYVTSNNLWGIRLHESKNNRIHNNIISNNSEGGLSLSSSGNNTISHNSLVNNHYWMGGEVLEHYSQALVMNNTIEGKHLLFWQNVSDRIVPSGAGLIILIQCDSIKISDQNLIGIQVAYSINLIIRNNNVSNGWNGIFISFTNTSTITNNSVTNNSVNGIDLSASDTITIVNNTVTNNSASGIKIWDSHFSTIANNSVTNNMASGIHLQDSDTSSITDNYVINNSVAGIYLQDSTTSAIANNSVTANGMTGIYLRYSSICTITNNTVTKNSYQGIALRASNTNVIENNNVVNNGKEGLFFIFFDDGECGIILKGSKNNRIISNVIANNTGVGVIFSTFEYSTGAPSPSYLISENNTIRNNLISNNEYYGIFFFSWTWKNHVSSNNIYGNGGFGVGFMDYSSDNVLLWNTFVDNNADNSPQTSDNGTKNIIFNNYWDSWTNPDDDLNGIVDESYPISGRAQNEDPMPLASPISSSSPFLHIYKSQLSFVEANTIINGSIGISWNQATDLLGHPIMHSLYYSSDGGIYWKLLAGELSNLSLIWDTTSVSDGTNYVLQLVTDCTDGNTQVTISESFIVYNHFIEHQSIIFPHNSAILSGTSEINWTQAVDYLGHSISYDLYYSSDGGNHWKLLSAGLSGSRFEWDTTSVFDGTEYFLKLIVNCSEGLRHEILSGSFIIYNNNPVPSTSITPNPTTSSLQFNPENDLLPLFQATGLIMMMGFVGTLIIITKKQKTG